MKTLTHIRDRNKLVRENVPDWQDQIDSLWDMVALLAKSNPAVASALQNDPRYQKILAVKAKFPKNPRG
jgi:hypothetical protein